jgi:hypothetical protein
MAGKHRKRAAGGLGCVVLVIVTTPMLILLTTLADQADILIG